MRAMPRTTEELLKDAEDTIDRDYCAFVEEIQYNASPIHKLIAELAAKLREREEVITPAKLEGLLDFIENEPELDIDGWTNVAEYCAENGIPYKGTNDSQEGFPTPPEKDNKLTKE